MGLQREEITQRIYTCIGHPASLIMCLCACQMTADNAGLGLAVPLTFADRIDVMLLVCLYKPHANSTDAASL